MIKKLITINILATIICTILVNLPKAYPSVVKRIELNSGSSIILTHQCYQNLSVTNAYSRASIGNSSNGVVFANIENKSGNSINLLGIQTDIAHKASLHTHVNDHGIMKMRPIDNIFIPAGKTLELKPGGYHIMLMGLKEPLAEGSEFKIKLILEGPEVLATTVKVLPAGAIGQNKKIKHTH
ncbi:MAG: hypothetical protein CMM58_10440 [Rhodospirillaceae bacterium]|nr:hypothetical protein [Rhodospirillaceae bacterium]|tara:strand:+ start:1210 stop:1755 length:546 start_codon:yes stop_codon:yes gene_type:complete